MSRYISKDLRRRITERSGDICEYCLIPPIFPGLEHQVEHIIPVKHGGTADFENLALACIACNLFKGSDVGSFDFAADGKITRFFNPREDVWTQHFQIDEDGIIESLTAVARVTIRILRFNDEDRIEERRELIESGLF